MESAAPLAKIRVISGGRGAGKTSLCQRQVQAARQEGWDVAGLLSPARFAGGQKTGIEAEDLRSGQRRLLASCLDGELQGMRLGPWTFSQETLEWGNRVIAVAAPCDLLVLDELGPLEFEHNQGWTAGFEALDRGRYAGALVVIRPECLQAFRLRWPRAEILDLASFPGQMSSG